MMLLLLLQQSRFGRQVRLDAAAAAVAVAAGRCGTTTHPRMCLVLLLDVTQLAAAPRRVLRRPAAASTTLAHQRRQHLPTAAAPRLPDPTPLLPQAAHARLQPQALHMRPSLHRHRGSLCQQLQDAAVSVLEAARTHASEQLVALQAFQTQARVAPWLLPMLTVLCAVLLHLRLWLLVVVLMLV